MRRIIACALLAVLAAVLGPRVVAPQSHAAGAPFAYEPPGGFVKDTKTEQEGAQVWVHETADTTGGPFADRRSMHTRIVVNHSSKEMSVEEADLAKLVVEMPKAFEGQCTWVHRRHEMRVRADGARVGLIDGDCDRPIDLGALGLPSAPRKTRKRQLMFPDDSGTSIVTTSYPSDEAMRWEPLLDATIAKAKGVAVRAAAPPAWMYPVWAAAGAVLGWLATALIQRPSRDEEATDA